MKLSEFPQLRRLSLHDKLELLDEIWQEVATDLQARGTTREERELLDRRWASFLGDPGSALDVEQFRAQLKARRA